MYSIEPIGIIETPYQDKFSVPRQPRLVESATARIKLTGTANTPDSVRGLEQYSHIWLLFLFDQNLAAGWKPTVRPPRLGGNQRLGVFATRSTFRPNGIGMSAVELKGTSLIDGNAYIDIGSCDLVSGTPIVDIKPYLPYSDSITNATAPFDKESIDHKHVEWTEAALLGLSQHQNCAHIQKVVSQVLSMDPRPAYKKSKPDDKIYATRLFDLEFKFQVIDNSVQVISTEYFRE